MFLFLSGSTVSILVGKIGQMFMLRLLLLLLLFTLLFNIFNVFHRDTDDLVRMRPLLK